MRVETRETVRAYQNFYMHALDDGLRAKTCFEGISCITVQLQ
jgi:hypothetical protein